jgi:hypothetical protein
MLCKFPISFVKRRKFLSHYDTEAGHEHDFFCFQIFIGNWDPFLLHGNPILYVDWRSLDYQIFLVGSNPLRSPKNGLVGSGEEDGIPVPAVVSRNRLSVRSRRNRGAARRYQQ